MRALRWILALAVSFAAPPATVVAQEAVAREDGAREDGAADPPRSDLERARQHMERGQALYLQARFEEAAAQFDAAYEAQAFSAFLFNAGVALERAGQPARAAERFEQYLSREPDAEDAAAVRARAERLRASAREAAPSSPDAPAPSEDATAPQETPTTPPEADAASAEAAGETVQNGTGSQGDASGVGQNDTVPGAGAAVSPADEPATAPSEDLPDDFKSLLSVRTNPEGATIRVRRGDAMVAEGPAPFAHTLDQGRYHVSVEHPDYQTVEQEVRIEPGKVYVVIVEMSQGQFLGYLRVVSNVVGADVYIDDREQGPRGQTPFEAPIPVGSHQIWVERPGYELRERAVEVGIGEDVTASVDLARVDYGRLRVTANVAGARVIVDGELLGNVPFEGRVPAGPRQLRIEGDGMKAFESEVTIARGQLTPVRALLRPDVDRSNAWVTTVFSALFLGGGIAVGVISNELQNDLRAAQEAGALANDDARLDLGLYLAIGADAGFGLSLILGCLALYYFLYDPLPPSEGAVLEARDWAFAPLVDPVNGAAGLGFEGRF